MPWSVETLNATVVAELEALPADMRAKFSRIAALIMAHGLDRIREPYVKHLEDALWEMRMSGRDGISRAIYVAAKGRRVVVVRVFVKKTERTPRSEIELARRRAEEVR
ncbi:MAG: type II toxin-antitoxin system RelE/ParE family toxin [Phreatobacter sp.]|nr:type II toxin-antitoxin system RelE/ParE family toxin [Phreatobacter sp.]